MGLSSTTLCAYRKMLETALDRQRQSTGNENSHAGSSCFVSTTLKFLEGILVTKTVVQTLTLATARTDSLARKTLTIVSIMVTFNFFISYAPSMTFNVYLGYTHSKPTYEAYEKLYMIREVA